MTNYCDSINNNIDDLNSNDDDNPNEQTVVETSLLTPKAVTISES